MEYIAHRGCADQFPENTIRAVRAVSDVVDRIEIDVMQCGSGEVILFHDETTDERTDGSHVVADTNYDTLRELRVLGSDEKIPLLSEALTDVPSTVDIQLDLKQRGIAEIVGRVMNQYDHDRYVCATDPEILQEVREQSWDANLGYVSFAYFQYEEVDPTSVSEAEIDEAIDTATDLECTFIEIPYQLCTHSNIVQKAQAAGLQTVAWTIRTEAQLAEMSAASVDAAMIDRIDIL